jgi:ribosomal protein S18 acetylase RimI-like enzyme
MPVPRPTEGAVRAGLEERLQIVRKALQDRDEAPTGSWVVESARDLSTGAKPGWYFPDDPEAGIAFSARRGPAAFGHVHAGGADAVTCAEQLATSIVEALRPDVRSINIGFSGLTGEEEIDVARRLASRPGSRTIERQSMERPLTSDDEGAPPPVPDGLRLVPARDVTLEALADLDQRAFAGTADELLVGSDLEEYRYVLRTILDGQLGRFVDEASIALVDPDPLRLVGAVLTAEQSIRRANLVDLLVDPGRRRRGYGTFLLRWNLRALRGLGYDMARLWATKENGPALALYDRFGFHVGTRAVIYRWERPGSGPQPHSPR